MKLIIALLSLIPSFAQTGAVQEEADKQQATANRLPMLMMLRQAGLISDNDVKQQVASSFLTKNVNQNRDLKLGGDDMLQTMMLMGALGGDKPKERGAMTSAILGGGDPLKSLLISSALTGSGTAGTQTSNNLLPILLMSSMGKTEEPRGGGSCMGKCGSAVPRQDCGCDIACRQNGDCCHDFDYVCFVSDVQAQPTMQVIPSQQFQQFQPTQPYPQFQQQPFQPVTSQRVLDTPLTSVQAQLPTKLLGQSAGGN